MKNKVEILIKVSGGNFVAVDVLDFPYRLNRVSFSTDSDKLKSLGGTTSTQIKFAKTKKTNQVFVGKTDFKSVGKFNDFKPFEAKIIDNGAQAATGTIVLEGTTHKEYYGTFYDNDANWINDLAQIKLNELGYVDGVPTWLVPFDGTITINEVNDLSNRETDFVCPLIQYNNTPILDYLDLTNEQIFELDKQFPRDFEVRNGFFGNRLGLNYNDILPAVFYRNILERIFAQLGLSVECPLFYEPSFNALILPYVGSKEYQFNWFKIAKATSNTPLVPQSGLDNFDDLVINEDSAIENIDLLPRLGGGAPIDNWFANPVVTMKKIGIIQNDSPDTAGYTDYITLFNQFNKPNQYHVPADNRFTINVSSGYNNFNTNFLEVYDTPSSPGQLVWKGINLWGAYASQDINSSQSQPQGDRWYGWDDNVLVILRRNENDGLNYFNTITNLVNWMNGIDDVFVNEASDVIAYVSPKRYGLWQLGDITNKKLAIGSPITDWGTDVLVVSDIVHDIVSDVLPDLESRSYADISITLDMKKDEKIEIFWISLGMIQGTAETWISEGMPVLDALDPDTIEQGIGFGLPIATLQKWEIIPNCGTYDLDLAANLPNITAKEFVSSFINMFNLHFFREGKTVQFTPIAQYYSPETFDITPRVDWGRGWESQPIATPKKWILGYSVDNNDKLLAENFDICTGQNQKGVANYGNVTVENQNTYASGQINDLVLFSSTKFIDVDCTVLHRVLDIITLPYEIDPISGFQLQTGIDAPFASPTIKQLGGLRIPSIQSAESAKTKLFGDLNRSFDYTPRLLYHLGTANQHYGYNDEMQVLIGYPRAVVDGVLSLDFIRKAKHWFRPTISQFDLENSVITGIEYPTLRFDTANGLYSRYFENLIELYNLSEQFTIQVAIRASDWANLKGYKKIRFQDQLYRLMEVKDYDPVTKEVCTVVLLKEV